jgi:phosphoglycolate phosphatase-like HAD superfamily hydrolase
MKLAIFDFDDTLVDSRKIIIESHRIIFNEYGFSPPTEETADKAPSKPHPAMLLQALSESGVSAEHPIMIGDTSFDMEMACAAGIHPIAVSWGYHRFDQLHGAGASQVVASMSELRDCLFEAIISN